MIIGNLSNNLSNKLLKAPILGYDLDNGVSLDT